MTFFKKYKKTVLAISFILVLIACRKVGSFDEASYDERLSGGNNTTFNEGVGAFGEAFPNLTERDELVHELGDLGFEASFVTAPSPIHQGLGPIYNNVSCASCHVNDGRGKAPIDGGELNALLIRISIAGKGIYGEPLGVPNFGGQLQQKSIQGKSAEAKVITHYQYVQGNYHDGTTFTLRKPTYEIFDTYMPLPSNTLISPRMAPPVFGLGLLEAISEATIESWEDLNDSDNDGISGKINYVWNFEKNKKEIGRFGWKAGQPNIRQQSAGAYVEDMGITNPIFKTESSFGQNQFYSYSTETDINDSILRTVTFYVQSLAVPARRNVNSETVQLGKNIFKEINCNGCHKNISKTATNVAFPSVSNQVIFPYTDLLLHDMGEDLADHREEFEANGFEWRTAPLWGIGLTQKVNGHSNFLHDGRARSIEEAILWHGGEAEKSKVKFKNLSKNERNALLEFLKSL